MTTPTPTTTQPASPPPPPASTSASLGGPASPPPNFFASHKKALGIGLFVVLLISIPLISLLIKSSKTPPAKSTSQNPTPASHYIATPLNTLPNTPSYVMDKLIVKYKPGQSPAELSDASQLNQQATQAGVLSQEKLFPNIDDPSLNEYYLVKLSVPSTDLNQTQKTIAALPGVDNVELDPTLTTQVENQAVVGPNDYYYPNQWNLTRIGMDKIWNETAKSTGPVTVAVIDGGVDTTAYDSPNIIKNVDDLDLAKLPPGSNYDYAHGTAMAGIIGAPTNNKIGISGITGLNPNIKLMSFGVCYYNPEGIGTHSCPWDAIIRALGQTATVGYSSIDQGAVGQTVGSTPTVKVVNIPIAGVIKDPSGVPIQTKCATTTDTGVYGLKKVDTSALQDIINYLTTKKGILVVTASGNGINDTGSGIDMETTAITPATCDNVLTVGASNYDDKREPYSNYGKSLSLYAPGGDTDGSVTNPINWNKVIINLVPKALADSKAKQDSGDPATVVNITSGTSNSAAEVSGVAALLFSANPNLTPDQVKKALIDNADSQNNLLRLNACKAFKSVLTSDNTIDCSGKTTPPAITPIDKSGTTSDVDQISISKDGLPVTSGQSLAAGSKINIQYLLGKDSQTDLTKLNFSWCQQTDSLGINVSGNAFSNDCAHITPTSQKTITNGISFDYVVNEVLTSAEKVDKAITDGTYQPTLATVYYRVTNACLSSDITTYTPTKGCTPTLSDATFGPAISLTTSTPTGGVGGPATPKTDTSGSITLVNPADTHSPPTPLSATNEGDSVKINSTIGKSFDSTYTTSFEWCYQGPAGTSTTKSKSKCKSLGTSTSFGALSIDGSYGNYQVYGKSCFLLGDAKDNHCDSSGSSAEGWSQPVKLVLGDANSSVDEIKIYKADGSQLKPTASGSERDLPAGSHITVEYIRKTGSLVAADFKNLHLAWCFQGDVNTVNAGENVVKDNCLPITVPAKPTAITDGIKFDYVISQLDAGKKVPAVAYYRVTNSCLVTYDNSSKKYFTPTGCAIPYGVATFSTYVHVTDAAVDTTTGKEVTPKTPTEGGGTTTPPTTPPSTPTKSCLVDVFGVCIPKPSLPTIDTNHPCPGWDVIHAMCNPNYSSKTADGTVELPNGLFQWVSIDPKSGDFSTIIQATYELTSSQSHRMKINWCADDPAIDNHELCNDITSYFHFYSSTQPLLLGGYDSSHIRGNFTPSPIYTTASSHALISGTYYLEADVCNMDSDGVTCRNSKGNNVCDITRQGECIDYDHEVVNFQVSKK